MQRNELDKVLLHEPGDNAVVSVKMTNSVCTQIDDYGSISRILIAILQQSGTFYDKHTTPVGLLNWFDDASRKIVSKHMVHINGDVWHEYVVPSLIREYFRWLFCFFVHHLLTFCLLYLQQQNTTKVRMENRRRSKWGPIFKISGGNPHTMVSDARNLPTTSTRNASTTSQNFSRLLCANCLAWSPSLPPV